MPQKPASNQQALWVRLPHSGEKLCGLGRTFLYALIKAKAIRSARTPGATGKGGVRLVDLHSLNAYIEARAAGGDVEGVAE